MHLHPTPKVCPCLLRNPQGFSHGHLLHQGCKLGPQTVAVMSSTGMSETKRSNLVSVQISEKVWFV